MVLERTDQLFQNCVLNKLIFSWHSKGRLVQTSDLVARGLYRAFHLSNLLFRCGPSLQGLGPTRLEFRDLGSKRRTGFRVSTTCTDPAPSQCSDNERSVSYLRDDISCSDLGPLKTLGPKRIHFLFGNGARVPDFDCTDHFTAHDDADIEPVAFPTELTYPLPQRGHGGLL